jgi:hypothetical protein
MDIVTADTSGKVSVLLGNGDGSFGAPLSFPTGGAPAALAVADLNGDGNLDIVTEDASGKVSVLLGNGDGSFVPPVSLRGGGPAPSLPASPRAPEGQTLPPAFPADSQLSLVAPPGLAGGTLSALPATILMSGGGSAPSPLAGRKESSFDPLPPWQPSGAAQLEQRDFPTERDILSGMDIARSLLTGASPQDIARSLLPGPRSQPHPPVLPGWGVPEGPTEVGKTGAQKTDVRAHLMSPFEDTVLGPPSAPSSRTPAPVLPFDQGDTGEAVSRRSQGEQAHPFDRGGESAALLARWWEEALAVVLALALTLASSPPGANTSRSRELPRGS